MTMYFVSKVLWEAVGATSGVSEAKVQQAHAAIVINLIDTQLMHVITTGSARAAWKPPRKLIRLKTWQVGCGW